jgi:renalase
VPQCLDLLPLLHERSELRRIQYRPCIALLFARVRPFEFEFDAQWLSKNSSVEWVSDNQKKTLSELPALTLHLNEKYSRQLFERSDDDIFACATSGLPELLKEPLLYRALHRWKFSQPTNSPFDPPFFLDRKNAPLLLIGDAFSGGRVEGALLSSLQGTRILLKQLSAAS